MKDNTMNMERKRKKRIRKSDIVIPSKLQERATGDLKIRKIYTLIKINRDYPQIQIEVPRVTKVINLSLA